MVVNIVANVVASILFVSWNRFLSLFKFRCRSVFEFASKDSFFIERPYLGLRLSDRNYRMFASPDLLPRAIKDRNSDSLSIDSRIY